MRDSSPMPCRPPPGPRLQAVPPPPGPHGAGGPAGVGAPLPGTPGPSAGGRPEQSKRVAQCNARFKAISIAARIFMSI